LRSANLAGRSTNGPTRPAGDEFISGTGRVGLNSPPRSGRELQRRCQASSGSPRWPDCHLVRKFYLL